MVQGIQLYRHDEIMTHRPYGVDVDADGWLWEGCGRDRLVGHHLGTAACRVLDLPSMGGHVAYQVFCWQGRMVMTLGTDVPYYLVVDPVSGEAVRHAIPGALPSVWYGTLTSVGKLLLYERSGNQVLVIDAPDATARVVACPYPGAIASGWEAPDGKVYSTVAEPARLVVFDLASERFEAELPFASAEAAPAGRFAYDGTLYLSNSAAGELLRFDLERREWREPIPTPDYGTLYGFMGGGFNLGSLGLWCLSTYNAPSRLDTTTGQIIVPESAKLGVDGRPPRFLDRFITFDAATGEFDYLIAPPQPDGVPLLCYYWTDGTAFAITGIVIPYDDAGEIGEQYGPWLVLTGRASHSLN